MRNEKLSEPPQTLDSGSSLDASRTALRPGLTGICSLLTPISTIRDDQEHGTGRLPKGLLVGKSLPLHHIVKLIEW